MKNPKLTKDQLIKANELVDRLQCGHADNLFPKASICKELMRALAFVSRHTRIKDALEAIEN